MRLLLCFLLLGSHWLIAAPRATLRAAQRVVPCPGRQLTPESNTAENIIAFMHADPVNIRLSLLHVGHMALAGVPGEVLTNIGTPLKREPPLARTFMTTHTNGTIGYVPDGAAYAQASYEVWVTKLKPGCAESAIVNSFLEMIEENQ